VCTLPENRSTRIVVETKKKKIRRSYVCCFDVLSTAVDRIEKKKEDMKKNRTSLIKNGVLREMDVKIKKKTDEILTKRGY
jgi:hypothetical protein